MNYRASCSMLLEVYFRIPAFSYTLSIHQSHHIRYQHISTSSHHYHTTRSLFYYFTIGVVCCGMHVVKNTLIFEPRCPNCLLYYLKRYCKREKLVGTICKFQVTCTYHCCWIKISWIHHPHIPPVSQKKLYVVETMI